MIAMMVGVMIIFRGVAYLFGFVWLAQLVEHLVYTEVGDQAQLMNSSFHNNTNRPSQLIHKYKLGIE